MFYKRPSHSEAIDHMNSKLAHHILCQIKLVIHIQTYSYLFVLIDHLLITDFGWFVKIILISELLTNSWLIYPTKVWVSILGFCWCQSIVSLILAAFKPGLKREEDTWIVQLEGKSDELKASSSNQGKHRSLLSVPCIMTQIDLSPPSESHGLQGEGRCQCMRSSLELEYVLVSKSFLDNFLQLPGAWA